MVMHGLDVDLDMENEFYAVNGVANYYAEHPIEIKVGETVRIYFSNMTEFDLVNNFHLHANMFDYYPNGTALVPAELTDTVNLCQGQRGIIEFSYKLSGHVHVSRPYFGICGVRLDGVLPCERAKGPYGKPTKQNSFKISGADRQRVLPPLLLAGLVCWFFHGGSQLIERAGAAD